MRCVASTGPQALEKRRKNKITQIDMFGSYAHSDWFVLRLRFIVSSTNLIKYEASSHDQIKKTKLWLEYDQNFFTTMNINIRTWPKNSQCRTWTIEHDRKIHNVEREPLNMTNKYIFWSCSPCMLVDVNFLVILKRSCWFGHVSFPLKYEPFIYYFYTNLLTNVMPPNLALSLRFISCSFY